jgi:hypothetical protein
MKKLIAVALSIGLALAPTALLAQAGLAGISPCAAETLAVSNVSANVQLSACGPVVILYNISSQELFYNFGAASNAAATTSNFSLPGNTYVVLNLNTSGGFIAAITAASTTTLRIVQGYANS